MRAVILILLAGLAACSSYDPATPSGKVFAFNPGEWTPAAVDLTVPKRPGQ